MKSKLLSLIWLQVCILSLPFSTSLADPLANALQYLKVVTGYASESVSDINGDQRIGLAEVIYQLRIAAGDIILPVASPILRSTLPASCLEGHSWWRGWRGTDL